MKRLLLTASAVFALSLPAEAQRYGNRTHRQRYGNETYAQRYGNQTHAQRFGNDTYRQRYGNRTYAQRYGNDTPAQRSWVTREDYFGGYLNRSRSRVGNPWYRQTTPEYFRPHSYLGQTRGYRYRW